MSAGWALDHLANPLVGAVLRSPLHGLLSGSLVLLTVTGRSVRLREQVLDGVGEAITDDPAATTAARASYVAKLPRGARSVEGSVLVRVALGRSAPTREVAT